MTEQTGENFQTSPELGFAFGRIPAQTVLDCLSAPELRKDREAEDIALYLSMTRDYFKHGPSLYIWHSYADAIKGVTSSKESGYISQEILEKYQEVADLIYQEHTKFVDDEAADINRFLTEYPGIISRDITGEVALQSVESRHVAVDSRAVRWGSSPVQQTAYWNDNTQNEIDTPTDLYVDMTALPEKYPHALNQYRTLYDIDLHTVY